MRIIAMQGHFLLPAAFALALAGCAGMPSHAPSDATVTSTWVEIGPQGTAQARAVVPAGHACPGMQVDDAMVPMSLRVAASRPLPRPTATAMAGVKPALFDMEVCEATLPSNVHTLRIGGADLPVPAKTFRRIVVLGDTGCRIKGADVQNCDNPAKWPFATVATSAARLKPDLVLHVGDYHYRETPCPPGPNGCATSPWGYGWDVWRTDFFAPAAPLLASAPWIFVRGNHEECARAGQGWFRLLAPEPWRSDRSCDTAANDDDADFTSPYVVPLAANLQLLVFDSAHAGNDALNAANPHDAITLERYHDELAAAGRMTASPEMRTWFVSHHPVLGYVPDFLHPGATPLPGNPALQGALHDLYGSSYFPPGVDFAIHGHVHLFQAIDFASPHPATLVAGNGGDGLDHDLPPELPPTLAPALGAVVQQIAHAETFGFLLLEATASPSPRWLMHAYRADGSMLTDCVLVGSKLTCTRDGAIR